MSKEVIKRFTTKEPGRDDRVLLEFTNLQLTIDLVEQLVEEDIAKAAIDEATGSRAISQRVRIVLPLKEVVDLEAAAYKIDVLQEVISLAKDHIAKLATKAGGMGGKRG